MLHLPLAETEEELANKSTLNNDRVHIKDNIANTEAPFEIHNQGAQGTGNDARGEVLHHYTDGTTKIIDKVGTGTVLLLRHVHNLTMRPDKPADFVGSGMFFRAQKWNFGLSKYEDVFYIDDKGHTRKSGLGILTPTFVIANGVPDTGFHGIQLSNTKKHVYAFSIRNGGNLVDFKSEGTKAAMVAHSANTGGLEVRADAGDLILKATNGNMKCLKMDKMLILLR